MAVWYPAMTVIGVFIAVVLVLATVGAVMALADLGGWRLLRALIALGGAIAAGAGWLREVRRWRELTPTAIRAR